MSDKPEVEPRLVSYGLNMETCTLNYQGKEYYFNLHPAPTPEVDPVGFISDFGLRLIQERDDISVTVSVLSKEFGAHRIPLYTHPAPSKLVKAARDALKLLGNLESAHGFESNEDYDVLNALCAELDKVKS